MVTGYQIDTRRELDRASDVIEGNHVEAKVGDRIDLENRVYGITIPWSQGFRFSFAGDALAENFSGAL